MQVIQTLGLTIGGLIVLALEVWLVWYLVHELKTGEANAAGTLYNRMVNSLGFRVTVCTQGFFALVCVFALTQIVQGAG